jgi:hypothetical protein
MSAITAVRRLLLPEELPEPRLWLTGLVATAISAALWYWITRSVAVAALSVFWGAYFTVGLRLAKESALARLGLAIALGGFSAAVVHFLMRQ